MDFNKKTDSINCTIVENESSLFWIFHDMYVTICFSLVKVIKSV